MVSNFTKLFVILSILIAISCKFQPTYGSYVTPIVRAVHSDVSDLGESPFWDSESQHLYYVDGNGGFYCRLNTATGELRKVYKGEGVRVFMPYKNEPGYFLVSRYNQLYKLHFETEEWTLVAQIQPGEDFNDAKCDTKGRLFVGTMANNKPDAGSLYRLDGSFLVKVASPFTITNGLAWSNDANSSRLFLNDSSGRKIYKFNYDINTGTLSDKEVMIDLATSTDFVDREGPDGMVIDAYGFIWVACWNGGRIVKIDVDTAHVVDQVVLPNNNIPSSLAKGAYQGLDGFYITTAACCTSSEDAKPDDGKIMHVGFQGGQVNTFIP